MTLSERTIDAGEIAAALGWSKAWFLRNVSDLTENHGMPYRMPGSYRGGGRWFRATIEAWLAGYDERKRAASRDEDADVAVTVDRTSLYLAYVNDKPTPRGAPQLVVDNTRARA